MSLGKKLGAEFLGTCWLVFGGCGSAVLASTFPNTGIGFLGVALAFGLTVLTMAYAIGHVSGCHLNPAVSIGQWVEGRFPARELAPYILAQVLGGILGAGLVYLVASGSPGFDIGQGLAANGYGPHSPGKFGLASGFVVEVVLTPGPYPGETFEQEKLDQFEGVFGIHGSIHLWVEQRTGIAVRIQGDLPVGPITLGIDVILERFSGTPPEFAPVE